MLQFELFARQISKISTNNAEATFNQMHSLSVTMTSISQYTSSIFPNITIPHFEERAREVVQVSGAVTLLYAPIVPLNQKESWEAYAQSRRGWNQTQAVRPKQMKLTSTIHPI
jgi:hypothetical protein